MPLPKRVQSHTGVSNHKYDTMNGIKEKLENAKKDLIEAEKAKNEARANRLKEIILDLSGIIERNS